MIFAAGGGPALTGCTTHQCDGDMVCIDSTGSMKTISQVSDCTPIITGGTPIPFYNLKVDDVGAGGDHALYWSTTSLVGPWLDFPAERTYVIELPAGLTGHVPSQVSGMVASDNKETPADASHVNSTLASGQLLESIYTSTPDTQLVILNSTCVDYRLRLFVTSFATPSGDAAGGANPVDASTPSSEASMAE